MNKKKDIIALALSVSFVMGGASLSHADEINTDTTSYISENQPRESKSSVQNGDGEDKNVAEVKNDSETKENENLILSEEKTPDAQKAGAEASTETNYSEEEKNIKDYNDSERYKTTDLEAGSVNQTGYNTDANAEKGKDGFKLDTLNPSNTSPSKTEYGYQITIDKETGQRTYTDISVSDSGNVPVETGEKPMMGVGDKLVPNSPDVTYKPEDKVDITGKKNKSNVYASSEETLKHINNHENKSTSFGFKDNYTQDNPRVKFYEGSSFAYTYRVNPWPNENDKLELMKLSGEYNEKVFVQGQDIDTKVKVDNIDENAKDRLVGQVYNPITGAIVPGASAYIGDDGNIHIQMPKGALKKDENGKYVVDKESIFNSPDYKALQNLDVKFFARPRTAEEFKTIAETPDEFGETGTYVETGAGTTDINHKGENVTIDKQGIDRYDHYNLIGKLKINLDDTRYYNQRFEDGNKEDTSKITSSPVKPGKEFEVKIVEPENPRKEDKSATEMNEAEKKGEAAGKINLDFINKANEGKAEKDKWKVDVNPHDISRFTVTPPKSAKAGDFVAIPVEYTYTNGSTDVHWFHFVVQESDNNRPEYHAEIGYKGDTLTQSPELPNDEAATKKNQPTSYELVMPEDGSKYKDSAGNEWTNIKVDPKTGAVTAVVPEDADIKGGENLFVDVKVNYIDEKTGEAKEEIVKAQFIARPKYKQEVTKTFNSKIPFETKVIYDDTLEIGKVVKTEGRVGETETTFKQVVINGEKGIIDENGNFVKDKEAVETKTITEKVDAEIRIGTKPAKTTVTIPADTDYETSDSLEKGTMQLKEQGEDGEVTITTSRDPETGEITTRKVITKEAKNKKMLIGTKTENTIVHEESIPFEYEVTFDPTLKPGEKVVDQEGKPGSKTTTYNIVNSKIVGDPVVKETTPIKAIIRVGDQKFTGETSHEVTEETKYITIVEEDPNLPVGETKEVQKGVRGSKTTKYTQKFENGVPGEVKEEVVSETQPQNRIVKVGTKTVTEHISKEITEEIPYKVEIKYDDTMVAGTTRVETPGQAGSKTTEYYRNLINGKFDGDLNTREVTDKYKAPINEVIVVGTKVETNNENYNDDVKVDVEYVEDNTLYKGTVNKGELTPGKVERKIVNKYDPETGKVSTEEKVVVTPAKQKIIVGTKDFTGEFTHTIEKTLPFEREIQYDETMEAGTKEVSQTGQTGQSEQTVTQKYTNGVLADKEYSKEETTKEPVKEIVKIGTKPVTKVVEKPFNTEYQYDENLEAGETQEETPGVNGNVTITTSYNQETGKVETKEETTAPTNRVVRIGGKTNGTETITEEIPFDVEVRKDPSLKKGEWKYATDDEGNELKGEKGEQEKTLTIVNSKVTETSEPTVTKKAKNAVILVGEGTNDGTHKVVEKKEIPFETRYEYDDSLEPGEEKVVTQGSPGEQERTNTLVIKDGKVTDTQEGEFKTTKEPQERLIKIGRKPSEGETTKTIEREIPYETKVIYDDTLEAGTQKIEKEGKPGKEEVTITQKIKDSKPVGEATETTKTITEKEDRVVKIGVKQVVKETELGHDTEYRYNPELKAGEEKVIEEGSKGSVKYTTTFNKETGKLDVKEERTEPKNKVVEYGSKTDGEFTYESDKAYDIIIRENPNLEAGKTNVIQEGKPGKTETTVKIENSKEVSRDTKTITEKQDKIIEIGTKNVCEIPPVNPEDPKQPGKDDPKDPEKPGEDNPKDPEKPGEDNPKDPEKPGEDDPKDPEKPGEDDPKDPEKPGEEDPKDQEKPGEDDPKDPEKPGEDDPKDPEKPGEDDPKDPEKPGEDDPKDPEKPGEDDPKDPEKPGEDDPKDPEKPGKDDPKDSETSGKDDTKNPKKPSRKSVKTKPVINKENANKNPKTGITSLSTVLSSLGLSLGALGFSNKRKKK
ncbi:G5 domain-containing protein [Anaerococcus jeddahensis]|uniref:G5 domain-containing protein n=1 Tax=Anaerococcus jeddahensis TaxID=1673719 RepID=UPI0006724287|nr:G5 domain-containing protein [Anaerococcus jeddahensis]